MTFNQNASQTHSALHPATHMGMVTLGVSNLAKSVDFYTRVLGMKILREEGADKVIVGAGSTELLRLHLIPNARRQPQFSTGLFHVAILLPSRPDLGRLLINLARHQYPVGGFGDHYVSEAIYLDDPDGNGLELYRDRPRSEWRWQGDQVVMGTVEVDVDGVIGSVENPDAPFTAIAEGTTIGHVHLRVGDIPKARAFYSDIIGFDVVADWHGALFVSAGRYHHHLGLNTWHSRNAPPAPDDSVGLREYTIIVPDAPARDQITARLDGAGIAYERQEGDVLVDDPWRNRIRIEVEEA